MKMSLKEKLDVCIAVLAVLTTLLLLSNFTQDVRFYRLAAVLNPDIPVPVSVEFLATCP